MAADRKYAFSWDLLGDIEAGRPNLGHTVRLEAYRLLEYSVRDVLEQRFGAVVADQLFRDAGRLAGRELAENLLSRPDDMGDFVADLQRVLRELGIGILRVEKADEEKGEFVVTVSEDLDCSGLPDAGGSVCVYDEGFIAAVLESYAGRPFVVRETDCWCAGDRTCRFTARPDEP